MKKQYLFENKFINGYMNTQIKKYNLEKQKLNLDYHDLTYELFKY